MTVAVALAQVPTATAAGSSLQPGVPVALHLAPTSGTEPVDDRGRPRRP